AALREYASRYSKSRFHNTAGGPRQAAAPYRRRRIASTTSAASMMTRAIAVFQSIEGRPTALHGPVMTLEPDDARKRARRATETDNRGRSVPMSPRVRILRAILDKLAASPTRPQPYPVAGEPSLLLTR